MDLQESTPRKYNLDIDYWVSPFRKRSRHALREAAGQTKSPLTTSSPRPMGLQDDNTRNQDADVGSDSVEMTSRTQFTKANQSRDLQTPSKGPTIDSQNCIENNQDMNLGSRRVIMPSLTQRTPGRLSLISPPPLLPGILGPQKGPSSKSNEDIRSSQSQGPPRAVGERASPLKILPIPSRAGLQGSQNEIPKIVNENLDPKPFEIASRTQSKQAKQPSSVPVLRRPPRIRPRNRFDVLRPDPYRAPSRVQREAVFKAVEELRAQEPCIIIPLLELPAEIRLIIYGCALTFRSPLTPRLKRAWMAESKEAQADAAESSVKANTSSLALLQTCRLLNREARPVYYASNTFRFTCAKDLVFFLHHTRPGLLNEVRKLHIEGLVTFKPLFTEEHLERFRRQGFPEARRQRLQSMRTGTLSDDAKAAAILLKQCPRLHRIHLVMASRYERCHVIWLLKMTGFIRTIVDLIDHSHWAVRLADSQIIAAEWYKVLVAAFADVQSRRALLPDLAEGQHRCIDVDLDMNYILNELQ